MPIEKCRVCEQNDLTLLTFFENMPINLWPTLDINEETEFYNLEAYYCKSCSHIQLQNMNFDFINKLYSKPYLNMESESINMKRIEYLSKANNFYDAKILDVGGGTNPSYQLLNNSMFTIIDPQAPKAIENAKILYEIGYISDVKLKSHYFDFIFAFHIIEHLENPKKDLSKLVKSMKLSGKLIIEVPDRDYYSKYMPFYMYFHQHISSFNLFTLDFLCESVGLHRTDSKIDDGRLLAIYEVNEFKKSEDRVNLLEPSVLDVNPSFFMNLDTMICDKIEQFQANNVIFVGAGGSTTLLLYHCPNLRQKINKLYDSDSRKIGLKLPGTNLVIEKTPAEVFSNSTYVSFGCNVFKDISNFDAIVKIDILDAIKELRLNAK